MKHSRINDDDDDDLQVACNLRLFLDSHLIPMLPTHYSSFSSKSLLLSTFSDDDDDEQILICRRRFSSSRLSI